MTEANAINGELNKYLQEYSKNRKDDVEICDLLKCKLVVCYRRFGTIYQSHI